MDRPLLVSFDWKFLSTVKQILLDSCAGCYQQKGPVQQRPLRESEGWQRQHLPHALRRGVFTNGKVSPPPHPTTHPPTHLFFLANVLNRQACKESCLAYNQLKECKCMEYRFPVANDDTPVCDVLNVTTGMATLTPSCAQPLNLAPRRRYCQVFANCMYSFAAKCLGKVQIMFKNNQLNCSTSCRSPCKWVRWLTPCVCMCVWTLFQLNSWFVIVSLLFGVYSALRIPFVNTCGVDCISPVAILKKASKAVLFHIVSSFPYWQEANPSVWGEWVVSIPHPVFTAHFVAPQDPVALGPGKTRAHCGGNIVFCDVARPWQNEATLLRAARTQEMFLKIFGNFLCAQNTKFVSDTNVAAWQNESTVGKMGYMITSAMLPPHCVLILPAP